MMVNEPWWKTGVIYQIYPRSFFDSNNDGIGDLLGIISKLDYLKGHSNSLGVDAIWLSPFYTSPQKDFGYDVSHYTEIDPCYGSLEDVKTLIEECNKRNLKVILDLVLNHTSEEHPWFQESRRDKVNSKRDWYIWSPARNGKPPNNWQSRFGGSSWTFDAHSGEYYLHSFLPSQPDLNWRNPQVQEAVKNVFKFWLDLGVAGFRLDVFNFYFKDAELRDNPIRKGIAGKFYSYLNQLHKYDKDQPELFETVRDLRKLVDSYDGNRVMLGEVDSDNNTHAAGLCYGKNCDGLHLAFNFDFLFASWNAGHFRKVIQQWEASVPQGAWPTYVLSNHDQKRHFSRFGNCVEKAKVACALLLSLRGTPVLYYGEEIGMRESRIPKSLLKDPPGIKYWPFFQGRDGCRTPMQWSSALSAGFSKNVETWLPVDGSFYGVNVELQEETRDSLLNFYKQILALRKREPALQLGSIEFVNIKERHTLCYLRTFRSETIFVALNFSDFEQVIPVPKNCTVLLFGEGYNNEENRVCLGAHATVFIKSTHGS